MFNRMPNFRITYCEEKEFEVYKKFMDENGKEKTVEGKYHFCKYTLNKDAKAPSPAQIRRNYINAVKDAGGTIIFESGADVYLKLEKNNRITWVRVSAFRDWNYEVYIIEEEEMRQDVFLDAKTMLSDINAQGRVALYGIYFDFDKSDVKPESDPTLKEISKLISENPKLNLFVVGHTDNVGDYNYNMKLSQARADAVVKTLVSKYNVDKKRLTPAGVGPLAPVTTNDTEEGKAKNRRVELIKK
jgi:outer membrane protein OmpA-like peptidoglycan-associated protein